MSNELQFNPSHDQFNPTASMVTQTPAPAGVRFPPGVYRFVREDEMHDLVARGWRLVAMTTVSVPVSCKTEELDQKKEQNGGYYGQQPPLRITGTVESLGIAARFLVMEDEESRVSRLANRVAQLEGWNEGTMRRTHDLEERLADSAEQLAAESLKVCQLRGDHARIETEMRAGAELRRKGEAELGKLRANIKKLTEVIGTREAAKALGEDA